MWLIAVWGCQDPQVAAFRTDRAEAICDRHARCDTLEDAGFTDVDACIAAIDGDDPCRGYSAEAADACLAALDVPCDETPDLGPCAAVCQQ